jgi:proline iminopeptidase
MRSRIFLCTAVLVMMGSMASGLRAQTQGESRSAPATMIPANYQAQEGFVDAHGVLIYYWTIGRGAPLVILHGGPGASHDYFLPYLLPLARKNQLIFIDERGSGKSQKLEDPKGYTVENMVEDVEAVRLGLHLGKISLLGHSAGGVLAEAYALKYQQNLTHLFLCSTFASTREMNEVFARMKEKMPPELRDRINRMEKDGLFGHGPDYRKGRYTDEYMIAAWGEGYFPYLYQNHPDPNYDPVQNGVTSWDLYREMWGSNGEFVIDGNMKSVEYLDRLPLIKIPTLIIAGDHDECDPMLSREMHEKISGSKLVILPKSGHMTFVDQPGLFLAAVADFLSNPAHEATAVPIPAPASIPATGEATSVALLSKPPELILAINKPIRKTTIPIGHVVYTLTEMDKVLLASELAYYDDLKVDIYYPPSYNFKVKLPMVVLANGYQETDEFDKDMPQHMDWAKLIAASGMIAVSAQAGSVPTANFYHVLEFLRANTEVLGIDLAHIGFWACSGQGVPIFKALGDKKLPYRADFRAAVLFYPGVTKAEPSDWPPNTSLFVVKAGADKLIAGSTIDNFVSQARSSKIPAEYIELADAPHGFDVFQNTEASKNTVRQSLEFLKNKLLLRN